MLSARVLSDHFSQVTLIEKDRLAASGEVRKFAPQGSHVHALLSRGRAILDSLFPGLVTELVDGGASLVGFNEAKIYVLGWRKRVDAPEHILSMTRPFLEWAVARRVRGLNNVTVLQECDAVDVLGSPARVTGVQIREANGETRSLESDLIVDARGRISNLSNWLKQLGGEAPAIETSSLASVYCSYMLEPRPGAQRPPLFQVARFEEKLGVLIFPVEGGRVLLSMGANAQMRMPKTHEQMLSILQTLPVPDAYLAVKDMVPLTQPAFSRFSASVRRRFDKLAKPPEGIVAIGDAVASFNPIFGQGMTVAALEAEWLGKCLAKHDAAKKGFEKSYYRGVQPIVELAWGFPDLESKRGSPAAQSPMTRFLLWYTKRLQIAATRNTHVSYTMARVQNMIAPPTALFSPSIISRVLFS